MQDFELYRQLLGVTAPRKVSHVSLKIEELAVYVYLTETDDATWRWLYYPDR
jgi:hypothetical protein